MEIEVADQNVAFAAGQATEAARVAQDEALQAQAEAQAAAAAVANANAQAAEIARTVDNMAMATGDAVAQLAARVESLEARIAMGEVVQDAQQEVIEEVAEIIEAEADEADEAGEEDGADDQAEAQRVAEEAEALERERKVAPKGRHRGGAPWV